MVSLDQGKIGKGPGMMVFWGRLLGPGAASFSILASDFAHLADEVAAAERGGGTIVHVDVMDGHFVPNITFGPPMVQALREVTKLPLDCHRTASCCAG